MSVIKSRHLLAFLVLALPSLLFAQATTASATYTGSDTTTAGNWTGKYGADGQLIATDLTNPPTYATASLSGDSTWIWASSSTDPRALQASSGSSSRIASTYYAASFTINLNLTDGNTHKISLYLCDFDSGNRAETISIVDAGSKAVLSTQSFSSFIGGIYATWTIKGNVQMQVVDTGGFNAVVNGIFFDTPGSTAPTTTASATYTGADTATLGNWTGKYGVDGQLIATDLTAPPTYATVSLTGDSTWVWANPSSDPRALQLSSGAVTRIASTYYASSFIIDVNLTDGNTHKISLYLCDFDSGGRSQTISVIDAASTSLLSKQSFTSFVGGIYETWTVKGHVRFEVVDTSGLNALVNGIFFDTPGSTAPVTTASATYAGADTTTLGNWTGKYGVNGQLIPSDLTSPPAYATVGLTGDSTWVWANPSSDPRSLQVSSGSSSHIASTYYANSFIIDVNLTDGNTHKISLYLCDFDSGGRAETISIVDALSKAVLSSQSFSSFVGGAYQAWEIKGHVQIEAVHTSGVNAVVNGIFFDPPANAPTVTITANPTQIQSGAGSTLSWSSTNTSACTASAGWSGTQPTSGSTSVSPTTTTSYTLTCTGAGGSVQATATVTVAASTVSYWVYYNGQFNWPGDYSFNATPNYASTAGLPLSGPYDIQLTTQQWGGWQPYAPNNSFNLTPYTYLTFALKPTVANQAWTCYFYKAGASSASTVVNVLNYGPAPVVGQWGVYTIPLTALGVSGASIDTFTIQDQSGLTSNLWYIDNVAFTPASGISYPPIVTFNSSPILFTSTGTTTLTWSSTNATSCAASGGWSGSVATSGTQKIAVTGTNSYALTCTGLGGSVTASASVTVTNPNAFSIQVSGNKFVNGLGKTVQLRGVNLSSMEYVAIQGWDPSDPTGGSFGQPDNPKWSAINAWKANIVRIPLNEDSWLGLTCTDTGGVVHNADPGGNYKQFVANLVQEANNAGIYVILDLHWAAPGNSCPMLQSQMADSDHSLAFWTSIANTYKNNPAVLFELFNEPFLDFDFTGDPWQYLMFGTGGSFSGYPATGNSGAWENVETSWTIASYQAMINAVRATGAANVVLIGSLSYTADLSGWLSHKPTDPIGQMAATWHPYPAYGATWGTPAWAQPDYAPEIFTEVQDILAAGIPVIATETGDQDSAGTVGAPLVDTITTFADANGVSVLGWTWDVWQGPDFILIQDVNGTPTDGYGQFFQSWMVNHP
jgi:hypothetical protein